MSLGLAEMLEVLARSQASEVVPQLGDSYAGRTAATVAALLAMLAEETRTGPARRLEAALGALALLASAEVEDPALAAELRREAEALSAAPGRIALAEGHARLLAAFARLHAWADMHAPALAARCRACLVAIAEADRLPPPGAGPAGPDH